jgi:hypothetical protein
MRSSSNNAPAASGAICRVNFRPGRRSGRIFANGAITARGNGFIRSSARRHGSIKDARPLPALPSSIVKRSRQRKKGAARVRRREEDQRAQRAYPSRYTGLAAGRLRPCRRHPRSGWGDAGGGIDRWAISALAAHLGGCGLSWQMHRTDPRHRAGARRDRQTVVDRHF